MENQIIAISYGPDEDPLSREAVYRFFGLRGFVPSDPEHTLLVAGDSSFTCAVFEKTGYLLFKENEGQELPEPVFDYIRTLKDKTTIVSLGVESSDLWEGIQTDSEYTLKRFLNLWDADYTDEE